MADPVIGIDLGTTHSEVAYIKDGRPLVISIGGSALVPSVVSLGPGGEILIGQPALNNELSDPPNTIRWIKRKMGTEAVVTLGGRTYTPAMISSLILRHLAQAASAHLGAEARQAVVTVPAFFDERAREATREAAQLAGLEVLRLVNEPTAAAMAYAMGNRSDGRWLVYDLGGGTFDVSVVDCSSQVMEVRASHGDVHLGGHDFDRELAHRCAEGFAKRHGIDLHNDGRAWARLIRAAEQAKIRLSTEAETAIREEYIAKGAGGEDLHLVFPVRRTELEAQVAAAIERTIGSVRQALEQASCRAEELKRVLLVGGVTRMPLVARRLREELGIEPQAWINPDTVVAQGAAIEAATIRGASLGAVMVDITPHTLGVGALDGYDALRMVPLIHRNTPLPCLATEVFYKRHDEQPLIQVEVYQGESPDPERCLQIGEFALEDLGTSSTREVHCKFELDRSGILTVSATDLGSGKAVSATIERRLPPRRANLADLEAVRLQALDPGMIGVEPLEAQDETGRDEEQEEGDADDDVGDAMDLGAAEAAMAHGAAAGPAPARPDSAVDADGALAEAERLLRGDLDEADRQDLSARVADVRSGAQGARERLADLLYFLQ